MSAVNPLNNLVAATAGKIAVCIYIWLSITTDTLCEKYNQRIESEPSPLWWEYNIFVHLIFRLTSVLSYYT